MKIRSLIGASAIAGLASAAAADTVQLQFAGTGAGRTVQVSVGVSTFKCFAGQLRQTFSGGTGAAAGLTGTRFTYSTDLTERVSPGSATYTVTPIADLPQNSGWPAMGPGRAQAVYDLFAAAAGQQFAAGGSADFDAAFQIALWKTEYESGAPGTLSMGGGNFKVTNADGTPLSGVLLTDLNLLLSGVGSNSPQGGIIGLSNNGSQDQVTDGAPVVPLPSAAWAGLMGLGLVAGFRHRLARR
jgi:hypothetical protein